MAIMSYFTEKKSQLQKDIHHYLTDLNRESMSLSDEERKNLAPLFLFLPEIENILQKSRYDDVDVTLSARELLKVIRQRAPHQALHRLGDDKTKKIEGFVIRAIKLLSAPGDEEKQAMLVKLLFRKNLVQLEAEKRADILSSEKHLHKDVVIQSAIDCLTGQGNFFDLLSTIRNNHLYDARIIYHRPNTKKLMFGVAELMGLTALDKQKNRLLVKLATHYAHMQQKANVANKESQARSNKYQQKAKILNCAIDALLADTPLSDDLLIHFPRYSESLYFKSETKALVEEVKQFMEKHHLPVNVYR